METTGQPKAKITQEQKDRIEELWLQDKTNHEIADQTGIAYATVAYHTNRMNKKLKAANEEQPEEDQGPTMEDLLKEKYEALLAAKEAHIASLEKAIQHMAYYKAHS